MKRNDLITILIVVTILSPFFLSETFYDTYNLLNTNHSMIMSFVKFALLATFGEMIALRLQTGKYNQKGFGIMPRAIVWGFLGITIKIAFVIFAAGTPVLLGYLGLNIVAISTARLSLQSVFIAFSISTFMNIMYAPIMMTFHKITDIHIITTGGTVSGLFKPIQFGTILAQIEWKRQWDFIFKKTIPFFWIPAHTVTFLLPANFQVLFAAMLGIALGIILSFIKSQKPEQINSIQSNNTE